MNKAIKANELKLFMIEDSATANRYAVRFHTVIHQIAGGYTSHTVYVYEGTRQQCEDFMRTAKHQKKVF